MTYAWGMSEALENHVYDARHSPRSPQMLIMVFNIMLEFYCDHDTICASVMLS